MTTAPAEPEPTCALCPRLARFRAENEARYPDYHNAPVPPFVPRGSEAELLIVGLAPGLHGANRTGRPFTGDYAGDLLYETLLRRGLAEGTYGRRADDGLRLVRCRVTNAVRCLPPDNKPVGAEVRTCRRFLAAEIESLERLRAILALGAVAHRAVVAVSGMRQKDVPFGHGRTHPMPSGGTLVDSFHCSRYNTNTGRLTPEMFDDAVATAVALLDG